ncbi:hypothetical protein FSOLCH5_013038 [Fusarium solani]
MSNHPSENRPLKPEALHCEPSTPKKRLQQTLTEQTSIYRQIPTSQSLLFIVSPIFLSSLFAIFSTVIAFHIRSVTAHTLIASVAWELYISPFRYWILNFSRKRLITRRLLHLSLH